MPKILCPAKINLGLFLFPKSENGYHNLYTLFLGISLFDSLKIETASEENFFCTDQSLPKDENNLVLKALSAYRKYRKVDPLYIFLEKNIPHQAGLGGGSSDAAGMLKLLNSMQKNPVSESELCKIAVNLGADVPFFLKNSHCLAEGIGEILTPVKINPQEVLILKPEFGISTKLAFSLFDETHPQNPSPYPFEQVKKSLHDNPKQLYQLIYNDFEILFAKTNAQLKELIKLLKDAGADYCSLSGSGSAIYSIWKNAKRKEEAFSELSKKYQTFSCQILSEQQWKELLAK